MSLQKDNNLREILASLSDEEILTLSRTVTQGFLKDKLHTREAAVDAILKYSPDETSLLRRKILTKELLFHYLHEKNVKVKLPVTKPELIDQILEYWDATSTQKKSTTNGKEKETTEEKEEINRDISIPPPVASLALKFTEWFYSMLNEDSPMGIEHYWADAKLKLNLISSDVSLREEVNGSPQEIVELLYKTKCEHNLYFNPNLTNLGVQGRLDPHGLVLVLSCGTLHAGSACVGIYEQVFYLARDPYSDNNWKIKKSELNLRNCSESQTPRLQDSDLTKDLLMLPST